MSYQGDFIVRAIAAQFIIGLIIVAILSIALWEGVWWLIDNVTIGLK